MTDISSMRRLVENEAVFREHNEKAQRSLEDLHDLATEEGYILPETESLVLQFYCECSDENCRLRIPANLAQYATIHQNRQHFVVAPGHEVVSIEKVIEKTPDYFIVEKFIDTPEQALSLNKTKINNI